jgi:hypothetical protein
MILVKECSMNDKNKMIQPALQDLLELGARCEDVTMARGKLIMDARCSRVGV